MNRRRGCRRWSPRSASFFESGDQNRSVSVAFGNVDAVNALVDAVEVDGDLRRPVFFAARRWPASRLACRPSPASVVRARAVLAAALSRALFIFSSGLLERAVAAGLLVVLGSQPDVVDVALSSAALAGEGDHLAVGRPDRLSRCGMPRDVERRPRAVDRGDEDVVVEVVVSAGIDEPLAVRATSRIPDVPNDVSTSWLLCLPGPSPTGRRGP